MKIKMNMKRALLCSLFFLSTSLPSSGAFVALPPLQHRYPQHGPLSSSSSTSRRSKQHRRDRASIAAPPTALLLDLQSFDLTRTVFLRGLGFVYGTAFLVAFNQNHALIGDDGITPARDLLESRIARGTSGSSPTLFRLLWFFRRGAGEKQEGGSQQKQQQQQQQQQQKRVALDPWLRRFAAVGLAISAVPLVTGSASLPLLLLLWLLYGSIVSVGGHWYGYGWESQLLETGFLAAAASPLGLTRHPPPSWLPVVGFRWLLFRIMLGSGLIKLRQSSSPCWRCWRPGQASCMEYFYETQPVPSPLARRLHFMPPWFHSGSTYTNHVVELLLPWLLLLPPLAGTHFRSLTVWGGGVAQLSFQLMLCASGNLSFLNVLTMLPAIWLLDDTFLSASPLGRFLGAPLCSTAIATVPAASTTATTIRFVRRHGFSMAVAALLAQRSGPVVENLVAGLDDLVVGFKNNNNTARRRKKKKRRKKRQVMNASFDRWRLVNTYGAFGFVGQMRDEMVIKGTRGNWDAPDEDWKEYDFAVKPGAVGRRLPTIVPYHHRLDWCVWIATLRPPDDPSNFWLKPLLLKLLRNDEAVSRLLEGEGRGNPFLADGGGPPKILKVERYRYRFAKPKKGAPVWERELLGRYFPRTPIFSERMLAGELQYYSNEQ